MSCIRCQAIEVAQTLGREQELADELYRQIDRIGRETVPRREYERVVDALAKANARLARRK